MSTHQPKHASNQSLLGSMAESIGSTLGTIAAKVSAVPDALSHSSVLQTAERKGKRLVRKSKTVARETKRSVSRNTKRRVGRATSAVKRVLRRASAKKKAAPKARRIKS